MRITAHIIATGSIVAALSLTGCSVAPKAENRETFKSESQVAKQWFTKNVKSFNKQIDDCGGYIIFPSVGRAGVVFLGGTFGRGAVYDGNGKQIGWARMGSGTLGLQIGAQGYKMAMILEDDKVLRRFKEGKWTGDVAATAVAANEGAAADAQFSDGVIVYVGDQAGLMAGVNVALSNVTYRNLDDVE